MPIQSSNTTCEAIYLPLYGDVCSSFVFDTGFPAVTLSGSDRFSDGTDYQRGAEVFSQLWPALVQCYVILALGYLAGRTHLLTQAHAHGLGTFLSNFALPSLLFRSLALMKLDEVNWLFLLVVLVAKAAVFLLVLSLSLLITRPVHVGKAGMYAITSQQSNDIALGYPIVYALYGNSVEVSYLYLVQPVSLVLLNPLGVACMELQRHRRPALNAAARCNRRSAWASVLRGILTNPIVLMSALGLAANFVLGQHLPRVVDDILKTLGDAFSGVALFFLGHSMVGKIGGLTVRTTLTATLLIAAKMLLLPLLLREVCTLLIHTHDPHHDLSSFAFLYGTFPTAPVAFLFATQYRTAPDVDSFANWSRQFKTCLQKEVAASVVIGTFVALPVMFVSAVMVMLRVSGEMDYVALLNNTAFDVSWLTLLAAAWVFFMLVVGRRMRSVPHQFTICLAVSQIICVVGLMVLARLQTLNHWYRLAILCIHITGSYACFSWVTVLAVSTCMLRVRGLCTVLRHKGMFYIAGFGAPLVAIGVLLITLPKHVDMTHSTLIMPHTKAQVIVTCVYVGLCLALSVAALVRQHRHDRSYMGARSRMASESQHPDDTAPNNVVPDQAGTTVTTTIQNGVCVSSESTETADSNTLSTVSRAPKRVRVAVNRRGCDECTGCDTGTAIEDLGDLLSFDATSDSTTTHPTPAQPSANGRQASPPANHLQTSEANERTPLLNGGGGGEMQQYTLPHQQGVTPDLCDFCTSHTDCNAAQYMVRRFYCMDEEEREMAESRDEHQALRHVILVILMLSLQLAVLFLALWRAAHEPPSGLYVELEFINVVLTAGQGIFLLGLFGFDTDIKMYPLFRRVREKVRGGEVRLPAPNEHEVALCGAFTMHHLQGARSELNACHWRGLRRYRCVFLGSELVDWLITSGVREDRESASEYACALLRGHVIEHVTRRHLFHDLPYIYRFVAPQEVD